MQAVIAAAITAALVQVSQHYFRGNFLGFVGFAFLFVLLVYLVAGCARYCGHRRRATGHGH